MSLPHNAMDLVLIMEGLILIQGFEYTGSNHVGCILFNATQFILVEPVYKFQLMKFNYNLIVFFVQNIFKTLTG